MGSLLEGIKPIQRAVKKDNKIWTSEKVDRWMYNYENGYDNDMGSPWHERNIGYRKGNLNFKWTDEEMLEIEKCANDIVYFSNKYCHAMTDEGVKKITLYDFQKKILNQFQENRFNVFVASRQVGKCCTHNVMINTKNSDSKFDIQIGELYSNTKKTSSFLNKVKLFLYSLYNKLNSIDENS